MHYCYCIVWSIANCLRYKKYCLNAGECSFLVDDVIVHGCMEENSVKSTCGGANLEFKVKKDGKLSIQNLTRFKSFTSKSDKTKTFWFKVSRVFFLIQNLKRCIFFNCKSDKMKKNYSKVDALWSFWLKIWLISCFSRSIKNGLYKRRMWGVCNLCLHNNRYSLFVYLFFFCYSSTDDGRNDHFVCTTTSQLWSSSGSKKWWAYEDLVWRVTKLLV